MGDSADHAAVFDAYSKRSKRARRRRVLIATLSATTTTSRDRYDTDDTRRAANSLAEFRSARSGECICARVVYVRVSAAEPSHALTVFTIVTCNRVFLSRLSPFHRVFAGDGRGFLTLLPTTSAISRLRPAIFV